MKENKKNDRKADIVVNSDTLKECISNVLHCVNPIEIRESMSGVYIKIDNDKMTFVGTNGIKLCECNLPNDSDVNSKEIILQYRSAIDLLKILSPKCEVSMTFAEDEILLTCDGNSLTGNLITKPDYPDYRKALEWNRIITVSRKNFTDGVRAVKDILDKDDNYRLTLQAKDKTFNLKVDGEIKIEHIFDHEIEQELDVDVNAVFLLSLLNKIPGKNLDICFMDGGNTVILKEHGGDNLTFLLSILRRRDDHIGKTITIDEKNKEYIKSIEQITQEAFVAYRDLKDILIKSKLDLGLWEIRNAEDSFGPGYCEICDCEMICMSDEPIIYDLESDCEIPICEKCVPRYSE